MAEKKKQLIYVASPYKSEIAAVREQRTHEITCITAAIAYHFVHIVPLSPITYTHELKNFMDTGIDWYEFDLVIMRRCDYVLVVKMAGWDQSYGVRLEIEEAEKKKIPVIYAKPDEVLETINDVFGGMIGVVNTTAKEKQE